MLIQEFKQRTFNRLKPVHVYRNLHNGLLSIRQHDEVVAHTDEIILKDVSFHVQPAGHADTIKTGQKTVHAYVKGVITNEIFAFEKEVFYNPFISSYFRNEKQEPIKVAKAIKITKDGKMFVLL